MFQGEFKNDPFPQHADDLLDVFLKLSVGVQTPTEGATNGSDQHSLAWLQLPWEARSALVLPTVAVCSAVFRVAHHNVQCV